MISKIFLTGLITFFLTGGVVSITEDWNTENAVTTEVIQEDTVKAILFNGEVIPLVELPTVEITGKRNTSDLVKATIEGGYVYPTIDLPEVVITPGA